MKVLVAEMLVLEDVAPAVGRDELPDPDRQCLVGAGAGDKIVFEQQRI
jgi:hypothetical protein